MFILVEKCKKTTKCVCCKKRIIKQQKYVRMEGFDYCVKCGIKHLTEHKKFISDVISHLKR